MRASREIWAWIGLATLVAVFLGVSYRLFSSRYWAGDIYPHFSSRSSSPEGTRALFEALTALPGREVVRNNRPLDQLAREWAPAVGTTVIVAGWPSWQLDGGRRVPEALDRLASAGARVIVAVSPEDEPLTLEQILEEVTHEEPEEDGEQPSEEPDDGAVEEPDEESRVAAERAARWAFELLESGEPAPTARRATADDRLPEEIEWRSPLHLELSEPAWSALYTSEGAPVLAERPYGEAGGTIVLAAGAFFLTNRAQSEHRQAELLARIVGPATHVIFDEAHLGLASTPGVVALGRRYRLHGVALAVAAVLALAVWRGAARLIPPPPAAGPHPTQARGSREGMVALLHRGVPVKRLLAVCLEQWSASRTGEGAGEEAIRVARDTDPVSGYRRLSELLETKKRSR
jgi:hypothetical protein